ncbi:hypothetical protein CMV_021982 [Castanea mollissima]|uniref:Uncharacterized protein n=1 Tax=Castanea mollissima TaxID=60419 RepID=A0A8J4QN19_9ROSI|nr:hypothetical protein CMV_021982 [Castanea mollissima]
MSLSLSFSHLAFVAGLGFPRGEGVCWEWATVFVLSSWVSWVNFWWVVVPIWVWVAVVGGSDLGLVCGLLRGLEYWVEIEVDIGEVQSVAKFFLLCQGCSFPFQKSGTDRKINKFLDYKKGGKSFNAEKCEECTSSALNILGVFLFIIDVYEFDDDTKDEAKYEDYDDSDVDDSDKYHGDDDGYDEDDDDDGEGSDDEQVEDLETKIEDFIAKGHKQWREELMHDQKFHCMAATELQ